MVIAQEAGADAAARLLQAYDPVARTWNLVKQSELWDAVALAHGAGRTGAGTRVAVIDGAFDTSLPALAACRVIWASPPGEPSAHGTAVALMILEVAPDCSLELYPTSAGGALRAELVERAIRDAAADGAHVINLSLGVAVDSATLFRSEDFLDPSAAWPDMVEADIPFWRVERLLSRGAKAWFAAPPSPLSEAVRDATRAGATVVAAAGNRRGHVFLPALAPEAFSIAFHRTERSAPAGLVEVARSAPPSFSQSELSDFAVIQPEGVLGSSFACPLFSGFAALMANRGELGRFRDSAHRAAAAAELMPLLEGTTAEPGWERRHAQVGALFLEALTRAPHAHHDRRQRGVCPECAIFAQQVYVDYGLFKLNSGDLTGAEPLLSAARSFAPASPHAAANLAMVYATAADRVNGRMPTPDRAGLLELAAAHMAAAHELRPAHAPYGTRLAEFRRAIRDPGSWELGP